MIESDEDLPTPNPYDGEHGFSRLTDGLGLKAMADDANSIHTIVDEIARRIAGWEAAPSKALLNDHEVISRLFAMTERADVCAYMSGGRLPATWWARVVIELDSQLLYDRLIKQIHRETHAMMAARAAAKVADGDTVAKAAGPETAGLLLESARKAAEEVSESIEALEGLDDSDLVAHREKISEWHFALIVKFTLGAPPGMPHEPHVSAYRDWMRSGMSEFMQQAEGIVAGIPNFGFNRLLDLVERIRRADETAIHVSMATTKSANARWARLEPVKQWAFDQRRANPKGSRASFIKGILPAVRGMAKEVDEPLTGDDIAVADTITRWFRKAAIR